jgi:hypothetical protein
MDPASPAEDQTFSRFWRQTIRWLVGDGPGTRRRLAADRSGQSARPRQHRTTVADSLFIARNDAKVTAHISSDSGVSRDLPLDWAIDRDGEYRASFTPDSPGTLFDQGDGHVAVRRVGRRYELSPRRGSEHRVLRRRDARAAPAAHRDRDGWPILPPGDAKTLPEDVALSKHGVTVVNQMDLWDMPAIFLLLVALVSSEWAYRQGAGARMTALFRSNGVRPYLKFLNGV